MSSYFIHLIADSNFARVIAEDNAALETNTLMLEKNTIAAAENALVSGKVGTAKKKIAGQAAADKTVTTATSDIKKLISQLLQLDKAQNTVGYNFMGLSIRIGQWIIPALIMLVSAMMPVIAGLLAMGAAAGIAGIGLVGALGLGALVMSHRMSREGALKQPEGMNGGGQMSIWTTLLKPIWDVIDSPEMKGPVDNAVLFVQTLFGDTIPNALRKFLGNIDPGVMMVIEQMFTKWLPMAAGGLSSWGSRIFSLIGEGSLARFNAFFKYLAGGIERAALWLAAGGWEQLDNISAIIVDVISTLLQLGKNALPVLNEALKRIWPMPLKFMLEGMSDFLDKIGKNKDALKMLSWILELIAIITAFVFVMGLTGTVVTLLTEGLTAFLAVLGFVAGLLLGQILVDIGSRIWWFGKALIAFFLDVLGSVLAALITAFGNMVTGRHVQAWSYMRPQEAYWDIMTGKGTEGRAKLDRNWGYVGEGASGAWGTGKAVVHLFLHSKDIDDVAEDAANKELGSNVTWEFANSQFSKGSYV